MSVTELMFDLRARGILLEAHGDRLRYSPKSTMTPELAQRMKAQKPTLLAILTADDVPAAVLWQAALDLLEDDPEFPPEMLADCRRASVKWERERPARDCANEPTTPQDRSRALPVPADGNPTEADFGSDGTIPF